MSDMETMTGFCFFVRTTSLPMMSDPTAEPPGLSTRNTMAAMDLSRLASLNQRETVLLPMDCPLMLSPVCMGPTPYIKAIFFPLFNPEGAAFDLKY